MSEPDDEGGEERSTVAMPFAREEIGGQIGRYRLLEKIGEGGFGVVYVAEQREPVKRRVAIKIIKLGMDTRQVVARFEAERQALAMMDHPNIAKVFDAGATETGRPYFVMELVRGIPITAYCDQNSLSPVQRLGLFISVCHAIQHAHQKGVIHRDIKPSNILVTLHDGVPVPKVIDFGIAKATQGDLTEKTVYTQLQQFIGTPAYMSPEQAEMSALDVDTRSDIYSLGVLLYELLTGTTPFDGKELLKSGMEEMRKRIREAEPVRPSHRLSGMTGVDSTGTAKRRGMEAQRLIGLLRGDLDWIVMKCLEKDRTRRYETANAVAVDIQRYLNNEPIAARPPSSMYRFWKLVRRNRAGFGAAAAVVVAILAGLGLATAGFIRANVERERAVAALADAEQQRALADDNFRQAREAVEDLLHVSDDQFKDQAGMEPVRMKLMEAVINRYEPFLAKPLPDPTPRAELARFYTRYGFLIMYSAQTSRGRDTAVLSNFEKARVIQEQLIREHPRDRSLRSDLGWTFIMENWRELDPSPAKDVGMKGIAVFRQLVEEDPKDPFARDDLGWAIYRETLQRSDREALALCAEAVAIREQLVKEYPASMEFRRDLANSIHTYSTCAYTVDSTRAKADDGVVASQRALDLLQSVLRDLEADRAESRQPERPSEAAARIVTPNILYTSRDVAFAYGWIGNFAGEKGDWSEAGKQYDQSIAIYKEFVERSPTVAAFSSELVRRYQIRVDMAKRAGERDVAVARSRDAVEFWKRLAGLHAEVGLLQENANIAVKTDAEVAEWLAGGAATRP